MQVYKALPDKSVDFKYNADGLRVQKKVTAGDAVTVTDYVLHGELVVETTVTRSMNGVAVDVQRMHFFYDAQSRPAMAEWNGGRYTYVHNLQGDVIAILDSNGVKVVEYSCDAWGRCLSTTATLANTLGKYNPFRYRGYVYDVETQLCDLHNRYYSTVLCRFILSDSVIPHRSMRRPIVSVFWYGFNSPVVAIDFSGEDAIVITDTYLFTHMSVLYQDGSGDWYYFYWGASKKGSWNNETSNMGSNSSMSAGRNNVCVIYEKIDVSFDDTSELSVLQTVNSALAKDMLLSEPVFNYKGTYDKALYLKGNYTKSHRAAKTLKDNTHKLVYSLTNMNCAHAVLYTLLPTYEKTKNDKAKFVIFRALTEMIPISIHHFIAKRLKS